MEREDRDVNLREGSKGDTKGSPPHVRPARQRQKVQQQQSGDLAFEMRFQ